MLRQANDQASNNIDNQNKDCAMASPSTNLSTIIAP